jgi:hypothetical protein
VDEQRRRSSRLLSSRTSTPSLRRLNIDRRGFLPDALARFAATPAMLGGVLFKLEDDPDP